MYAERILDLDYKTKLYVLLLLDISESMGGEKIESMSKTVHAMINDLAIAQNGKRKTELAIITYGKRVKIHTYFSDVKELAKTGIDEFEAEGIDASLGAAINMAKNVIEDIEGIGESVFQPAVILTLNGNPSDEWERAIDSFNSSEITSQCSRFAVVTNEEIDESILHNFSKNKDNIFIASTAASFEKCFMEISKSVVWKSELLESKMSGRRLDDNQKRCLNRIISEIEHENLIINSIESKNEYRIYSEYMYKEIMKDIFLKRVEHDNETVNVWLSGEYDGVYNLTNVKYVGIDNGRRSAKLLFFEKNFDVNHFSENNVEFKNIYIVDACRNKVYKY